MIVVLAGGVGGARFLRGLVEVVGPGEVTAIVNTGDDFVLYGLRICPDLDTVTYTLAGSVNPVTGWGLEGDSVQVLAELSRYGAPTWFRLGDRDLATHLYRTMRLQEGASLSQVTKEIAQAWGIETRIVPMTDQDAATLIRLEDGSTISFQDYFVRLRHEVTVSEVILDQAAQATPAPEVTEALAAAEVIVIAPSNPILSIAPIRALQGMEEALRERRECSVAISPLIGGRAVKGPLDRLLVQLGEEPSAVSIARAYRDIVATFVLDRQDAGLAGAVAELGMRPVVTDTLMDDLHLAAKLAAEATNAVLKR
jgi:LPPG:FO 2-phospho-L-lactate transferase